MPILGLDYTPVEGSVIVSAEAINRLERQLNSVRADVVKLSDTQDELSKTLGAVTKTCDRILDRLDHMDSEAHLVDKRIHNVESDVKAHTAKVEELVTKMEENANVLVKASVSVGKIHKAASVVGAGGLGVGGIAFVVDMLLRLFGAGN